MTIVSTLTNPLGLRTYKTSSSHAEWIRSHYRKGTRSSDLISTRAEAEAFISVREILLDQEIRKGVISPGEQNQIKDFWISFGSQTASYTNPQTGNTEAINLPAVVDPAMQGAIQFYYEKASAKSWQKGFFVSSHSKGNLLGPKALQRETKALKALPKKLSDKFFKKVLPKTLEKHPGPYARNIITRRFLFAEKYMQDLIAKTKEKIKVKQQAIGSTKNQIQAKALREEIQRLSELVNEFEHFDAYALVKTLSTLPAGPVWESDLQDIANKLAQEIREDIQAEKGWFSSKELTKEEEDYVQDVVGMLFLERGAYFRYCDKHHLSTKRENVVDIIIRAAVRFGVSGTDYTGEEFKHSILLDQFSPELRKEVEAEMNGCAVVASPAIPHLPESYQTNQSKDLVKAVQEHRAAVDNSLTLDKVPKAGATPVPPPQESPVTNRELVIAGTAAAAGTALAVQTGAIIPQSVYGAAHHLYDNPGLILGVTRLGAAGLQKLRSFVAPVSYDEHGYKRRNLSYGKLLAITGIWMATLYGMNRLINWDEDQWPDETTWSVGSIALWVLNMQFKAWMMAKSKEAITSAVPQIGQVESAIVERVEGRISEKYRPTFHVMRNVVANILFVSLFNRMTSAISVPSFETVAETTRSYVPLLQPIKDAGSWAWNKVTSFLPNIGYGAFI